MTDLSATIKNVFPGKQVVIAGDVVADQFLHGSISRVSREAPVFILRHEETETRPGGAANAAANVASLGGKPLLVGLTGDDENGRLLRQSLTSFGVSCDGIITEPRLSTTTKVRVLAGQSYSARQQVIRIDYENSADLGEDLRKRLIENFRVAAAQADAIVISDYGYGVADDNLFAEARAASAARDIPLLIDSRFRLREFPNATSATPNQDEAAQLLGGGFADADCERLCEELGFRSLLITRGNKGMTLVERGKQTLNLAAVGTTEPVDGTGAGDTVMAAYAMALASGLSFSDAAIVANHAGGIVVMKKGTATAGAGELVESLSGENRLALTDTAS